MRSKESGGSSQCAEPAQQGQQDSRARGLLGKGGDRDPTWMFSAHCLLWPWVEAEGVFLSPLDDSCLTAYSLPKRICLAGYGRTHMPLPQGDH